MSVRPGSCSPFQMRGSELINAHRLRTQAAPITVRPPPDMMSNWCYYASVASSLFMLLALGVQPSTESLRAVGTMYTLWSPVLHSSCVALKQQPVAVAAFLCAQGAALQMSLGEGITRPSWPLSAALLLATAHLLLRHPPGVLGIISATLTCVVCLLALIFEGTLAWRIHASTAPPLAFLFGLTAAATAQSVQKPEMVVQPLSV